MNTQINRAMSGLEWTMLLGLSVLWGTSFLFVGIAVTTLPAFTIVAIRLLGAAAILWLVLVGTGTAMPRSPRVWAAFFGMGLLNNALPFCLIVSAQLHLASGVAAILNAATPLFTVLVAHALTRDEKLTKLRLFGVAVGFCGVAVMIGIGALRSAGADLAAPLAMLGAAFSYACAGVFGRRFRRMQIAPMATATGQITASALMMLPVAFLVDSPWLLPEPGLPVLLALAGLCALSTAAAYILYFRILATAGATNVLLVTFLVPVSAILFGILILGEHLAPRHMLGMALIGAGLAAIDGRLFRRPA